LVQALLTQASSVSAQVAICALDTLTVVADCEPGWLQPSFERVLLKLFALLSGPRDVVIAAEQCLKSCVRQQPFDRLFNTLHFLQSQDDTAQRGVLRLLAESIAPDIPRRNSSAHAFLTTRNGGDPPLQKLLVQLCSCDGPRDLASLCIERLHNLDQRLFAEACYALSAEELARLRQLANGLDLSEVFEPTSASQALREQRASPTFGGSSMQRSRDEDARPTFGKLEAKSSFGHERRLEKPRTEQVRDGRDSARNLVSLLSASSRDPARVLDELGSLAPEPRELWQRHFGRVLILVLDNLSRDDVRPSAVNCLDALIEHHPVFFEEFAEVVASKLFEAFALDKSPLIERCLLLLLEHLEPVRALEILLPALHTASHERIGRVLLMLHATVKRMPAPLLHEQLAVTTPALFDAFHHADPEVRKTTVLTLVDMHQILGERLLPYLAKNLTESQLKLVTIYIQRAK